MAATEDPLEKEIKKFNSMMKRVDIIETATEREVRDAYNIALRDVIKDDTDQLADETKRTAFAKRVSAEIAKAARSSLKVKAPETGKEDVIEDAKLMRTHTNLTYDTIKSTLDRTGKNTDFDSFYRSFSGQYREVTEALRGAAGQHIDGTKGHVSAMVDRIDERHVLDPKYIRKQELLGLLDQRRRGIVFTEEGVKGAPYAKGEYRVPEEKKK